jgi:hypothetical protein
MSSLNKHIPAHLQLKSCLQCLHMWLYSLERSSRQLHHTRHTRCSSTTVGPTLHATGLAQTKHCIPIAAASCTILVCVHVRCNNITVSFEPAMCLHPQVLYCRLAPPSPCSAACPLMLQHQSHHLPVAHQAPPTKQAPQLQQLPQPLPTTPQASQHHLPLLLLLLPVKHHSPHSPLL